MCVDAFQRIRVSVLVCVCVCVWWQGNLNNTIQDESIADAHNKTDIYMNMDRITLGMAEARCTELVSGGLPLCLTSCRVGDRQRGFLPPPRGAESALLRTLPGTVRPLLTRGWVDEECWRYCTTACTVTYTLQDSWVRTWLFVRYDGGHTGIR